MKDIRIEKAYGLLSEKNDMWQDQCEICLYLIGLTDYYLFAVCAAGKIFVIHAKGIQ
jgi:hypothetical protein